MSTHCVKTVPGQLLIGTNGSTFSKVSIVTIVGTSSTYSDEHCNRRIRLEHLFPFKSIRVITYEKIRAYLEQRCYHGVKRLERFLYGN